MFDMLKPGKGFVLTLRNKVRIEVDFGPMSRSEKINSSQRECDMSPASGDAEIRVYTPTNPTRPSEVHHNATVEQLAEILNVAVHPNNIER